jgi:hypothetical protein
MLHDYVFCIHASRSQGAGIVDKKNTTQQNSSKSDCPEQQPSLSCTNQGRKVIF